MDSEMFETRYLASLNPQQRKAVLTVNGPVLVLATPGSGKTTVLVLRLGYMLLVKKIDPRRILTMTYTRAAARDMRERFSAVFGEALAEKLQFRTINGVAARIIARAGRLSGREPFRLLEDDGERSRILREVWQSVTGQYPEDADVRDFGTAVTYIKNMLLTEEALQALDRGIPRLPELYRGYQAALRSRRLMDYDDQLCYALTLLQRFPELSDDPQISFQYLCVDEAQDNSRVQHELIRLLASRHENLFLVGDEDQSIYAFRAAFPEALLQFPQQHPDAQVLLVEENYRSTPEIVAAANRFIARNKTRHPKTMRPTRPSGAPVHILSVPNRRGQYTYILRHAASWDAGTAVLFRNNDSLLPLADGLDKAGIPFTCRNYEDVFFTGHIIPDITDTLRLALSPRDSTLFLRLYYRFGAGISKSAAEQAVRLNCEGESLFQSLLKVPDLKPSCRTAVFNLVAQLNAIPKSTASEAVRRVWDDMHYSRYAQRSGLDSGKYFILSLLAEGLPSAQALLKRLDELRVLVSDVSSRPKGGLVLSTVHSSKGLEYDRVYLLDMLDGILPSVKREDADTPEKQALYEEERRLFYVAMTRAKEELFLFLPPDDFGFVREVSRELPRSPKADHRQSCVSSRSRRRGLPGASPPSPPAPTPEEFIASHGPGSRVLHTKFGRGTVVSFWGDLITVQFETAGTKKMSLFEVLRKGYLKGEDPK